MLNISWTVTEQQQWDHWHRNVGGAIQQHWAYGAALCNASSSLKCLRAVVDVDSKVIAIAQFMIREFGPLLRIALCSRGPLWLHQTEPGQRASVLNRLKQELPLRGPKLVFFSPDDHADSLRPTQGLRRVMTGYSTVEIDLSGPEDFIRGAMHAKWRNRLVAAEASSLRVSRNGIKPAQYAWLLNREGLQRQQRGYQALPADFVQAYQQANLRPSEAMLMMRADLGKSPVAAMMFLIHGKVATYHIGWSDQQGRDLNAHNLLLWRAILALKQAGISALDMGGVNTQRGAGIARFKIGAGGEVQTFAGTFC